MKKLKHKKHEAKESKKHEKKEHKKKHAKKVHHKKKHHSKESSKFKSKVKKVMHEFKSGKLHAGSKKGPVVSNPKQGIAIALNVARRKVGK